LRRSGNGRNSGNRNSISSSYSVCAEIAQERSQLLQTSNTRDTQVKSEPNADTANGKRFSDQGLHTVRAPLDLSARESAKLLGVSDQSVHKWETEHAVPRTAQLASIVATRKVGKRKAQAKLALVLQSSTNSALRATVHNSLSDLHQSQIRIALPVEGL
jgi:DNA-binding transcriptional regulator YiaG